jgi:hypothetical protein
MPKARLLRSSAILFTLTLSFVMPVFYEMLEPGVSGKREPSGKRFKRNLGGREARFQQAF